MHNRINILIICEGVSLAHIGRPLVLAKYLANRGYRITFACDERYKRFVEQNKDFTFKPIKSIASETFMKALYWGKAIYNSKTLEDYIQDDIRLISDTQPDLIIGDFRVSLSISAKVSQVPYYSLSNAHWSPHASVEMQAPETIYSKIFGLTLNRLLFNKCYPLFFKAQAMAFNTVAKRYGFMPVQNILEMYTTADKTLYLDPTHWLNFNNLPANQEIVGPIIYSPEISKPKWFEKVVKASHNSIYATLGSSGDTSVLPNVCTAIRDSGNMGMIASAGRADVKTQEGLYCSDYLPGETMLEHAKICICNGGSATVYQSLSKGVPIIGIPQNLDQFLTMSQVLRHHVGVLIRPTHATAKNIKQAIEKINQESTYHFNAEKMKEKFKTADTLHKIESLINTSIGLNHETINKQRITA